MLKQTLIVLLSLATTASAAADFSHHHSASVQLGIARLKCGKDQACLGLVQQAEKRLAAAEAAFRAHDPGRASAIALTAELEAERAIGLGARLESEAARQRAGAQLEIDLAVRHISEARPQGDAKLIKQADGLLSRAQQAMKAADYRKAGELAQQAAHKAMQAQSGGANGAGYEPVEIKMTPPEAVSLPPPDAVYANTPLLRPEPILAETILAANTNPLDPKVTLQFPTANRFDPLQLINSVVYGYESAAGMPTVSYSLFPCVLDANLRVLQIGVKFPAKTSNASPATFTLVIDTTENMKKQDSLGMVVRALRKLGGHLGPEDHISVLTLGSGNEEIISRASGGEFAGQLASRARLEAQGSGDPVAALRKAYARAAENFRTGTRNRVIIIGRSLNIEEKKTTELRDEVRRYAEAGITLSVIKMGDTPKPEIAEMSAQVKGRYAKAEDTVSVLAGLLWELDDSDPAAAEEVAIDLRLPPNLVLGFRRVGEPDLFTWGSDSFQQRTALEGEEITLLYLLDVMPRRGGSELGSFTLTFMPAGGTRRTVHQKISSAIRDDFKGRRLLESSMAYCESIAARDNSVRTLIRDLVRGGKITPALY